MRIVTTRKFIFNLFFISLVLFICSAIAKSDKRAPLYKGEISRTNFHRELRKGRTSTNLNNNHKKNISTQRQITNLGSKEGYTIENDPELIILSDESTDETHIELGALAKPSQSESFVDAEEIAKNKPLSVGYFYPETATEYYLFQDGNAALQGESMKIGESITLDSQHKKSKFRLSEVGGVGKLPKKTVPNSALFVTGRPDVHQYLGIKGEADVPIGQFSEKRKETSNSKIKNPSKASDEHIMLQGVEIEKYPRNNILRDRSGLGENISGKRNGPDTKIKKKHNILISNKEKKNPEKKNGFEIKIKQFPSIGRSHWTRPVKHGRVRVMGRGRKIPRKKNGQERLLSENKNNRGRLKIGNLTPITGKRSKIGKQFPNSGEIVNYPTVERYFNVMGDEKKGYGPKIEDRYPDFNNEEIFKYERGKFPNLRNAHKGQYPLIARQPQSLDNSYYARMKERFPALGYKRGKKQNKGEKLDRLGDNEKNNYPKDGDQIWEKQWPNLDKSNNKQYSQIVERLPEKENRGDSKIGRLPGVNDKFLTIGKKPYFSAMGDQFPRINYEKKGRYPIIDARFPRINNSKKQNIPRHKKFENDENSKNPNPKIKGGSFSGFDGSQKGQYGSTLGERFPVLGDRVKGHYQKKGTRNPKFGRGGNGYHARMREQFFDLNGGERGSTTIVNRFPWLDEGESGYSPMAKEGYLKFSSDENGNFLGNDGNYMSYYRGKTNFRPEFQPTESSIFKDKKRPNEVKSDGQVERPTNKKNQANGNHTKRTKKRPNNNKWRKLDGRIRDKQNSNTRFQNEEVPKFNKARPNAVRKKKPKRNLSRDGPIKSGKKSETPPKINAKENNGNKKEKTKVKFTNSKKITKRHPDISAKNGGIKPKKRSRRGRTSSKKHEKTTVSPSKINKKKNKGDCNTHKNGEDKRTSKPTAISGRGGMPHSNMREGRITSEHITPPRTGKWVYQDGEASERKNKSKLLAKSSNAPKMRHPAGRWVFQDLNEDGGDSGIGKKWIPSEKWVHRGGNNEGTDQGPSAGKWVFKEKHNAKGDKKPRADKWFVQNSSVGGGKSHPGKWIFKKGEKGKEKRNDVSNSNVGQWIFQGDKLKKVNDTSKLTEGEWIFMKKMPHQVYASKNKNKKFESETGEK